MYYYEELTRIQYLTIQRRIENNDHLKISGPLSYSADIKKATYYNIQNGEYKKWLFHDMRGYFCDRKMVELLK